MKNKATIYFFPILLSAILLYAFSISSNSSSAGVNGAPESVSGLNVLILVHDSTLGSATNIAQKKADRDTLRKYIPDVVGAHTLVTFDTSTALPDLTPYDFIIIQETGFDVAASRYLGAGARAQIKAWLASGTSLSKKKLLMIGGDQGYNYSRLGSNGRDLEFADTYCRFIYRVDNKPGSTSPAIIGTGIDVSNSRSLTSSPPSGGYWPDGCSPSTGGVSLYRYQNSSAADSLAMIGVAETGYRVATMFQDPRYFTGEFGAAFDAAALWVNENVPLPVELASFTHTVSGSDVTLNWVTSSEINNAGFDIERSVFENNWTKIGHAEGHGTTSELTSYSFTDKGLRSGSYSYRLKQIDFNGNFTYYNLNSEVNVGAPESYSLSQNFPNPFNPTTTIEFTIPEDGFTALTVYDMSGKEVSRLVNEFKSAGFYKVNFNAASLSSGNYIYRLESGKFSQVKKMILVK